MAEPVLVPSSSVILKDWELFVGILRDSPIDGCLTFIPEGLNDAPMAPNLVNQLEDVFDSATEQLANKKLFPKDAEILLSYSDF